MDKTAFKKMIREFPAVLALLLQSSGAERLSRRLREQVLSFEVKYLDGETNPVIEDTEEAFDDYDSGVKTREHETTGHTVGIVGKDGTIAGIAIKGLVSVDNRIKTRTPGNPLRTSLIEAELETTFDYVVVVERSVFWTETISDPMEERSSCYFYDLYPLWTRLAPDEDELVEVEKVARRSDEREIHYKVVIYRPSRIKTPFVHKDELIGPFNALRIPRLPRRQ